jgi:hypothetical protein
MTHEHKKLSDDPTIRGHETSDANAKSVFISGIGLSLGLVLFGFLFAWGTYKVFQANTVSPGDPARTLVDADSSAMPPLPRLQADPHVTLVPFVKNQDSILASYDWVNKDSGIARIPVERAMKLLVKQGLAVQQK